METQTLHAHAERFRAGAAEGDSLWMRICRIAHGIARAEFRFDAAEAEDIAQEMALRAFRHAAENEINLSWICAGTRFLCIDRMRSFDAQNRAIARYGSDLESRRVHAQELSNALAPVIALLPHPCRDLIRRYYWAGMTWSEIDAALESGHRCSQYQMKKCLDALRAKMDRAAQFQVIARS